MLGVVVPQPDLPVYSWDDVLSPHIYVFYGAFIISFIFTPVMRSIAMYYGIIDRPDHVRKLHSLPVAYLGGVAVFMGWVAGLAVSQLHIVGAENAAHNFFDIKINMVAGWGLIVFLGFLDDVQHIRPIIKLIGQVAAAGLLIMEKVVIHCVQPMELPLH